MNSQTNLIKEIFKEMNIIWEGRVPELALKMCIKQSKLYYLLEKDTSNYNLEELQQICSGLQISMAINLDKDKIDHIIFND